MSRRDRLHRRLAAAAADREVVDVHRFGHRSATVTGVVLATGRRWTLVAEVADDGFLDGLTAIRLRGIRRVRPAAGFARLVAPTRPDWPPAAPEGLALDRT